MTRQETIDKAVAWAIATAQESAHGYDQTSRWGPDYDCSSFVISAWEQAGVPVRQAGASFTGNMKFAFLKCGFRDVENEVNLHTGAGLRKGDVLLNEANHTELYIGDGRVVKASINEYGTVTGGRPGDQTGREIYVGGYYNGNWDAVLRFEREGAEEEPGTQYCDYTYKVETHLLKKGNRGAQVKNLQILLNGHGFDCGKADGVFGDNTYNALRDFQTAAKIGVDGEWGGESFKAAWNYDGG